MDAENAGSQLYLIMGADQFAAFKQWHQWREIVKIAIICIAGRARFDWVEGQFETSNELQNRTQTLQMPQLAVSATQIRQLLAGGLSENQSIADLLPKPVARYIAQHQLYKAS